MSTFCSVFLALSKSDIKIFDCSKEAVLKYTKNATTTTNREAGLKKQFFGYRNYET